MDSVQVNRIQRMEQALNASSAAVAALETALAQYEAVLPQLMQLAHYYESPLWMQDYEDDNAGKLPRELCRGVLTEDALFDLLGDADHARELMARLAAQSLRSAHPCDEWGAMSDSDVASSVLEAEEPRR